MFNPGVVVVVVVVVPGVIGCGGGVVVWFIICICNPLCSLFILCLVIFNYIKYRHFEKKFMQIMKPIEKNVVGQATVNSMS